MIRTATSHSGVRRDTPSGSGISTLLTSPLAALILSTMLALGIYACFFVQPLFLGDWLGTARLDIGYLFWERPLAQARLLAAFLALWGLYLWGGKAARQATGRAAWTVTLTGALACGGTLLLMTPFDAADIYDNILHGRILGIYGGNPYSQVALDYPKDAFFNLSAWKHSPSAYGPLWELPAGLTARLAGDSLLANLLAFKLLCGIFWAGSILLVAMILRRYAPRESLAGVYWLSWNPLVLYSTWGNGHNDVAIVFWSLLAIWLVLERRFTCAVLALTAGTLTKYIPVLLIPSALVLAWRALPGMRQRQRFLSISVVATLILIVLAYLPLWAGFGTLTIERRLNLFSSSIPAVAYHVLKQQIGTSRAAGWVAAAAASLTALFTLWRARRALSDPDISALAKAGFDTLTFYLLVTCLWFQQWYVVWLVGLAALLPPGFRRRFAFFFSLAVLSKQLVVGPLLFWTAARFPQPGLEALFTLGVLGLPWLYIAAPLLTWRRMKGKTRKQEPIQDLSARQENASA